MWKFWKVKLKLAQLGSFIQPPKHEYIVTIRLNLTVEAT